MDLNPYQEHVKDKSPILPVCFSQIDGMTQFDGQLCSCGNKYGNETSMVVREAAWKPPKQIAKNTERKAMKQCFKYGVGYLSQENPSAVLINMCNVVYKMVAPPGTRSWIGTFLFTLHCSCPMLTRPRRIEKERPLLRELQVMPTILEFLREE